MGAFDAEVVWFRFEHEPSYCLKVGPKYDFVKAFESLEEQFAAQAIEIGRLPIFMQGEWKDSDAYDRVSNFFLNHRIIFGNHPGWGPDFGMPKEQEGFWFPDRSNQGSPQLRYFVKGNYRMSLLSPEALGSISIPFEGLLDIQEEEINTKAIETCAAIVRNCKERNNWLAFSFIDT
jgi:hypothetical protein